MYLKISYFVLKKTGLLIPVGGSIYSINQNNHKQQQLFHCSCKVCNDDQSSDSWCSPAMIEPPQPLLAALPSSYTSA